jgi:hypothetical protein
VTSLDLRFRMMSPLGWGADVSIMRGVRMTIGRAASE